MLNINSVEVQNFIHKASTIIENKYQLSFWLSFPNENFKDSDGFKMRPIDFVRISHHNYVRGLRILYELEETENSQPEEDR